MAEVKKLVLLIIGLFLINLDFVSDLMVGLGLYNACHYYFAFVSFFFSSLPSILIFIFLTLTSIFPNIADRMTTYVKNQSGLYPFQLLGLVFCFPLYHFVIKIKGYRGHLGEQTESGLQVLVALAQSMPQLIFTCYIRANLGPGYGGWKGDVINRKSRSERDCLNVHFPPKI